MQLDVLASLIVLQVLVARREQKGKELRLELWKQELYIREGR